MTGSTNISMSHNYTWQNYALTKKDISPKELLELIDKYKPNKLWPYKKYFELNKAIDQRFILDAIYISPQDKELQALLVSNAAQLISNKICSCEEILDCMLFVKKYENLSICSLALKKQQKISRNKYFCGYAIADGRVIFDYQNFYNEKLDFIITKDMQLVFGMYHLHLAKHAPFLLGCGAAVVNEYGYLIEIENCSGHYQPNLKCFFQTAELLKTRFRIDTKYATFLVNKGWAYISGCLNIRPEKFNKNGLKGISKPRLEVEIPPEFKWEEYRVKNKLTFLKSKEECEKHYRLFGHYQKTFLFDEQR